MMLVALIQHKTFKAIDTNRISTDQHWNRLYIIYAVKC